VWIWVMYELFAMSIGRYLVKRVIPRRFSMMVRRYPGMMR